MPASSLLALIDDIATILDDVSIMTKIAAKKTAGVLGDDLALNAEQVLGLKAERELPVVFAVGKGSLKNKLILIPAALAISYFTNWLIMPLLMFGGAFLCFEGMEKISHIFLKNKNDKNAQHLNHLQAIMNEEIDLVALEQEKIKGAVRTDFVLSAEIITITLGIVAQSSFLKQLSVLCGIGLIMTFGVYGLVAIIVKLDDVGLFLSKKSGKGLHINAQKKLGNTILQIAPYLMKGLSFIGTAAMFSVGGGIIKHGLHLFTSNSPFIVATALDMLTGIIAGTLMLGIILLAKKVKQHFTSAKI